MAHNTDKYGKAVNCAPESYAYVGREIMSCSMIVPNVYKKCIGPDHGDFDIPLSQNAKN